MPTVVGIIIGIIFGLALTFMIIIFIRAFKIRRQIYKKYTPEQLVELEIDKMKAELEFYKSLAKK